MNKIGLLLLRITTLAAFAGGLIILLYALLGGSSNVKNFKIDGQKPIMQVPMQVQNLEPKTLEKPNIRLHHKGQFRCSGTVVSRNIVLTADHCVTVGDIIEVVSDSGRVTVLARTKSSLPRQDLAVVEGDFHSFESLDFEYQKNVFLDSPEDEYVTCGYPWGSHEYRCFQFKPEGNSVVMEYGKGRLYFGMSGGGVIHVPTGKVVGVNSAVGEGYIVIAPLIGLETIVEIK